MFGFGNPELGVLMLALFVVFIMFGFPIAFTLMALGVFFGYFAMGDLIFQLLVQRSYSVMTNDVLISIPLFVFMGYLVERANLIEKLFRSLQLALARVPGSLAVATLATCAIFATATGIVGAVVTLMGLLAMPQMLRAGYGVRLTAGSITAGGCLGILLPPSVMLIVYGATAGVSVVQLYAGAFFPGVMLAGLYILYVMLVAKIWPKAAPPLPLDQRVVPLPPPLLAAGAQAARNAVGGLLSALKGRHNRDVPTGYLLRQLGIALLPVLLFALAAGWSYRAVTAPLVAEEVYEGLQRLGSSSPSSSAEGGLAEPPDADDGGLAEPPDSDSGGVSEPPGAQAERAQGGDPAEPAVAAEAAGPQPLPTGWWIGVGTGALALLVFYGLLSFARFEVFKMLLTSFFPLLILITAVLGSIVFGLATPTEAAAVGAFGGALLAIAYRRFTLDVLRESVYLTAKTSAMVCWLFVGSAIFSAAFALLGGQELVERWVLGMDLTPTQFLILSQVLIFLLGWPLEWTEIIVIFMPIFVPLLDNFGIDPLFFGLLVALNLQTAFLSPPVAMSAFYLKGVAPAHVSLNQIFLGMMPFMGIQIIAIVLLYIFPQIGMWLPQVLYR